ncbi:fimbrial protein [Providencia stuartii]|uniref:fimbrial protein n=1 Tax=Providencia TaxID=586 RepID=UPI0024B03F2F|nr:fimbrial protein [Providencia sp. 2023EL-00965]ELR5302429.1 fimbrial protein [Providencia stuartii]MDW7590862.1 fimbrial protein [Providencia sp. 2023EL-00965]
MKKIALGLSLLGALVSNAALSTPTANIKVIGDIKPPTCNVNGGDNDLVFDLGKISPSLIPKTGLYALPEISKPLNVSCDAATYLTFTMSDTYPITDFINQLSSQRKDITYGLVDAATGKEVGGISFTIKDITVDGQPSFMSATQGSSWTVASASNLSKNRVAGWTKTAQNSSVTSPSNLNLISGKQFGATIHTFAGEWSYSFIKGTDSLDAEGIDISNGLDFVGQAIMTFNFGV